MPTIRSKKERGQFVTLDKTALHDEALSMQAKGLHSYMMSMPDDWVFYETELMKHFTNGRDAIRNTMKELETRGYLVKEQKRQGGKFGENELVLYEKPQSTAAWKTVDGKTADGKTVDGKPDTTNNNALSNNLTKNDLKRTTTTGEDEFQQIVDVYTNKINQNVAAVHEYLMADLEEFGLELLIEAINEAALSNIRNYKYVRGILNGWKDRGVTTMQGLIQDRADFEQKKQSQQKRKSWSPTKETAMKKTPEWLEKDAEEQRAYERRKRDELAASVPDDHELEKLLAEMRGGA